MFFLTFCVFLHCSCYDRFWDAGLKIVVDRAWVNYLFMIVYAKFANIGRKPTRLSILFRTAGWHDSNSKFHFPNIWFIFPKQRQIDYLFDILAPILDRNWTFLNQTVQSISLKTWLKLSIWFSSIDNYLQESFLLILSGLKHIIDGKRFDITKLNFPILSQTKCSSKVNILIVNNSIEMFFLFTILSDKPSI